MKSRTPRVRLDEFLVQRGQAASREKARALILAGRVSVAGSDRVKPGLLIRPDVPVTIAEGPEYVSRGGHKLAHALDTFGASPAGLTCADIGASTGGFTDCLLQRGAARVYAIDVGYGQLAWKLQTDPRVVVLDRTNARYLEKLPELVDLVVADASFISLQTLLPAITRIARPGGALIALVKPQFEAGKDRVGKGGVVRDPDVHRDILETFARSMAAANLEVLGLTASPIRGPAGNVEFLAHVRLAPPAPDADAAGVVHRTDDGLDLRVMQQLDQALAAAEEVS
jgi:23S rRNA (cytidine1920-2'-O)/16S rRNA (cytidine1409-2'-O)-methyltransferase